VQILGEYVRHLCILLPRNHPSNDLQFQPLIKTICLEDYNTISLD
jgi:hypothetical protein